MPASYLIADALQSDSEVVRQSFSKQETDLHTYFQSVVSSFGPDAWPVIPGSGVVVVVPSYAAIFQIGIGGALCFDLTNARLFK